MTSAGSLQLCYDARILAEYKEVLKRPKFEFDHEHTEALLAQIEACGVRVVAEPLQKSLPDPQDEPFLAVAIAGRAACLVTGNTADFPSSSCQGIPVFSPNQFLEFYKQSRK
jgi:predicted nucleic acid-binding protein